MEFSFTEEQQMIRDTAASFLAEVSDSEAVRRAMATEAGYEDALWSRITEEMYWHAVHIPEDFGGLGLGYVELVAMLEEMGKHLTCSPFYSTVCLGVNALRVAGTDEQQEKYLSRIAADGVTATLAWTGATGRWDVSAIDATYTLNEDGAVLDGRLRYVPDGHTADLLVIAARKEDSSDDAGIGLFIVPADADGVTRAWLPTMDQTRKQAEIDLSGVRVDASDVMRDVGYAWPLLAMKHKAADMMLKAEAARSAVYYAACIADEFLSGRAAGETLAEAASIAKAYCSDAYFYNAGCALQMHGGIGFTWEHDVHLYFKRAKSTQQFLGDAAFHRERLSRQILGDTT
jgi:alkylation response protein AidB-like acyl-CoA dehydrogenase